MKNLSQNVENLRNEMIIFLTEMCRIPAIAPESGGDGEAERASFILMNLSRMGFQNVEIIESEDKRVSAGHRPNIIVTIPGSDKKLPPIWVVSHMDIVPEGDLNLWKSDPYDPILKKGMLIGRGVEDNGQSLTASVFAARAILGSGEKPQRDVKLAIVADEEVGSKHGIQYLLSKKIFGKNDLLLVPDAGSPDGSKIEVVEKSHLQLKVITHGKQAHASRPHKGTNAFRAASKFVAKVSDVLYEKFDEENKLFDPPFSTFECTKKEPNVPNVNTIPGEDVFYMDCRVLPKIDLGKVMKEIEQVARDIEKETGAKIKFDDINMGKAPMATPPDSPIVKNLQRALHEIRGIKAEPMGIGGGTCAAFFRAEGLPAVVWETNDELAHEPNEYCKVSNMVDDAKVMARLFQL
ncbi:MAG: M20 family metallo-hydrolase [Thermoplasmata archaeon]|nr:M20 family metallo-hydrolase [Thermoplasmata archaeon]